MLRTASGLRFRGTALAKAVMDVHDSARTDPYGGRRLFRVQKRSSRRKGNLQTRRLMVWITLTLSGAWVALAQAEGATKVAMGNRSLYLSCLGSGSPTVVMEAGYGDTSEVWAGVQPQIAAFTQVCVYDRAGLGRSDFVSERTVREVVADLAAVIEKCPVEGPVVLVGHSIGGLIVGSYAHEAPEKVAGMVLVDSSHPDQLPRLHSRLPSAWLEALDTFFEGAPAFETWDSDRATAQGRTPYMAAASLGDMPLVVLTRDVERIDPDGISWIKANIWSDYSTEVDRLYGAAWMDLQRDFLALSSASIQVVVKGSTHYIHRDRPEVVVHAVRRVVAQARTRQSVLAQNAR